MLLSKHNMGRSQSLKILCFQNLIKQSIMLRNFTKNFKIEIESNSSECRKQSRKECFSISVAADSWQTLKICSFFSLVSVFCVFGQHNKSAVYLVLLDAARLRARKECGKKGKEFHLIMAKET